MSVREIQREDGTRKSEKRAAADSALKKAASSLNRYKNLSEQNIMGRTVILRHAHIWALGRYVGITRGDFDAQLLHLACTVVCLIITACGDIKWALDP